MRRPVKKSLNGANAITPDSSGVIALDLEFPAGVSFYFGRRMAGRRMAGRRMASTLQAASSVVSSLS